MDDMWITEKYDNIDITTGASGDIRQANQLVKKYLELFENYIVPESISDTTQYSIENRISDVIKECLEKAVNIIENNINEFYLITNLLLKNNTIVY